MLLADVSWISKFPNEMEILLAPVILTDPQIKYDSNVQKIYPESITSHQYNWIHSRKIVRQKTSIKPKLLIKAAREDKLEMIIEHLCRNGVNINEKDEVS